MGLSSKNDTVSFDYSGSVQELQILKKGIYKIEAYGAAGGNGSARGGYGGYTVGYLQLNYGDTLYICVGSAGSGTTAGWNGGGVGQQSGGGATSVTKSNRGVLKNFASYQSEVYLVAGGGGGSDSGDVAGNGGGLTGGNSAGGYGTGGSQSAGGGSGTYAGSFGQGGTYGTATGGGGGGWYGGGASKNSGDYSGGGGSGYIGGCPSFTYEGVTYTSSSATSTHTGAGSVKVTLLEIEGAVYFKVDGAWRMVV